MRWTTLYDTVIIWTDNDIKNGVCRRVDSVVTYTWKSIENGALDCITVI